MNISFHYFAAKTVARAARYSEKHAQRVTTYSQLIDDYDWRVYLRADNISNYVNCDGANVLYNEKLNGGSYISSMLDELKNDIVNNRIPEDDALMKMGMLFHTFSDTYAHQLFTGYGKR